jgi:hypothetical protein
MAKHKKYCKGEGGGFPQIWVVVNFVSLCLLMAKHKKYYKGEGGGFPQIWAVVNFVATPLWRSVRMTLTLLKWGLESPQGLSKTQNSITGVKTSLLEVFLYRWKGLEG